MHPIEPLMQQAHFLVSAANLGQCPEDTGWEVAFAGRSNAGKSSAINVLTCKKALARTSKTPGRTRLLNFFTLDEQRRLVDLPGYGYARVARQMRQEWQKDLDLYLSRRQCLAGLILLMDCRHPLKDIDRMIIDWAASSDMPLHILLTKSDKLGYGAAKKTLQQISASLEQHPAPLSIQLFSATTGAGKHEAWDVLAQWLEISTESSMSSDDARADKGGTD